jgi:hypothetical protein
MATVVFINRGLGGGLGELIDQVSANTPGQAAGSLKRHRLGHAVVSGLPVDAPP